VTHSGVGEINIIRYSAGTVPDVYASSNLRGKSKFKPHIIGALKKLGFNLCVHLEDGLKATIQYDVANA
jgi:hypothetical protein